MMRQMLLHLRDRADGRLTRDPWPASPEPAGIVRVMVGNRQPIGAPAVALRPAACADVDGLRAMHARCSPDSLYRRYLAATGEISTAVLGRLLTETATTVAVARAQTLVAMGNVVLGGRAAEVALLVEDAWQRRGIGVTLATVLADQALRSGAEVLTATVLATNLAIRRTLAAAGLAPQIAAWDYGNLELRCDLRCWRPDPVPSPLATQS